MSAPRIQRAPARKRLTKCFVAIVLEVSAHARWGAAFGGNELGNPALMSYACTRFLCDAAYLR